MTNPKKPAVKKQEPSVEDKLVSLRDSTNEALNGVNEKIGGLESGIQDILKALSAPAVVRKSMDAEEKDLGRDETPEFVLDKAEDVCIKPRRNLTVNDAEFKEKNDMEMFMRQMVKVRIHHSSNKNDDPIFPISVNGKTEYFARGTEKKVMRMFVEGLARAKPVHYSNEKKTMQQGDNAIMYYEQRPDKMLRYPFAVIEDTRQGETWLQKVLAQP